MTTTLKSCPFCGCAPSVSTRMDEDIATHNIVEYTQVSCGGCEVSFERPTHAYHDQGQDPSIPLAIHYWQQRDVIKEQQFGDGPFSGVSWGKYDSVYAHLNRVTNLLDTWASDHSSERTAEIDSAIHCARAAITKAI